MSEHDMDSSKINRETCVDGYGTAWLYRLTRPGSEVKLQGHSKEASKGSMKLKRKMLSSISSKGLRILYGTERVEILPDMNKEPLLAVDGKNSKDGEEGETSNTATQSMDVEHFLNNNKLFKECKSLWSDPEMNSRSQVKRLKTNASDYTRSETKSMMAVGASRKESDFVYRILKCGTNKPGSRSNQEPFTSQIKNLNMGGRSEEGITLQHPWIQRWCKKKATVSNEGKV